MEDIIDPIDRKVIIEELTGEKFLRSTNKAGNQVYLVNHQNSPNILKEIGRLRELSFRSSGGGTGKALDIDKFDLSDYPYEQLLIWDPQDQEIIAGYRLLRCRNGEFNEEGNLVSATSKLFKFSDRFNKQYLTNTLELGRSFVQPKYQRGNRKGLFSLDNLWDGLAAVMSFDSDLKYMLGKVTMYPDYNREARDILLSFMHYYFPDNEKLIEPHNSLVNIESIKHYADRFKNLDYKQGHQLLTKELKERNEGIPPLINSYMNLSNTMKTFGTAANTSFGQVEETGILVDVSDIDPAKKARYFDSIIENEEFKGPLFQAS